MKIAVKQFARNRLGKRLHPLNAVVHSPTPLFCFDRVSSVSSLSVEAVQTGVVLPVYKGCVLHDILFFIQKGP